MHRSDHIFYYFPVNFIARELQFFALYFKVSYAYATTSSDHFYFIFYLIFFITEKILGLVLEFGNIVF